MRKPTPLFRSRKVYRAGGSALAMVVLTLMVLTILGVSLMQISFYARSDTVRQVTAARARLGAEAAYEKAVFWMSQQQDMLSAIEDRAAGITGTVDLQDCSGTYEVDFYTFARSRPIYRIQTTGTSGRVKRQFDAYVMQNISGWDMGMCRIPTGTTSTSAVNFADGEIIDMPIHINDYGDSPDSRDIHIKGSPDFRSNVEMGESRYAGSSDKYSSVMGLFDEGIVFDQPDTRISDVPSVQAKIDRFFETTKHAYSFKPTASASVTEPQPAVHLEFYVENNVGKVRITNNCTVRGYLRTSNTYDYRVDKNASGIQFEPYAIYAYHLRDTDADTNGDRFNVILSDTYVSQSSGTETSTPGGQIYVDGNVVIGSGDASLPGVQDTVKGQMTVVATGNIWLADAITLEGAHDVDGMPSESNPNALGLIAGGVIKIVDPGMSEYSYVDGGTPDEPSGYTYVPIGREDSSGGDNNDRHLPDPMVVEAVITVGGGGWGAENVRRGSNNGRKEADGNMDDLIVRGALAEVIRGIVSIIGSDGYVKQYYMDDRLFEGIVPGDFWLKSKFVPAPAGWSDILVLE